MIEELWRGSLLAAAGARNRRVAATSSARRSRLVARAARVRLDERADASP
jgi:hypothetical protein